MDIHRTDTTPDPKPRSRWAWLHASIVGLLGGTLGGLILGSFINALGWW